MLLWIVDAILLVAFFLGWRWIVTQIRDRPATFFGPVHARHRASTSSRGSGQ